MLFTRQHTDFHFTSWWLSFAGSAHWRQWRRNQQDVGGKERCKEMGNGRRCGTRAVEEQDEKVTSNVANNQGQIRCSENPSRSEMNFLLMAWLWIGCRSIECLSCLLVWCEFEQGLVRPFCVALYWRCCSTGCCDCYWIGSWLT